MPRSLFVLAGVVLIGAMAVATSGGATQAQARWVVRDLGTFGGQSSRATAINNQGQIVGSAETKAKEKSGLPIEHAFLWANGKMRDLGTLARAGSGAVALNEQGTVIGWSYSGHGKLNAERGGTHAFLWENGRMTDLGTFGGPESYAVAINDHGQVVGWADTKAKDTHGSPLRHAFLWQNGKRRDLGTLGGKESAALDINEKGQVVGWSTVRRWYPNGEAMRHAFLWERGKMRDLGALPGEKESQALAINDAGQVLVYSYDETFDASMPGQNEYYPHAFLWQNGRKLLLSPREYTLPSALNEQGVAVGEVYPNAAQWMDAPGVGNEAQAFSWRGGKMKLLPRWEGEPFSWAEDLNARSQIVGVQAKNGMRACLWQAGGALIALPVVRGGGGRVESEAVAINDQAQIVGASGDPWRLGPTHAVLWTLKRG